MIAIFDEDGGGDVDFQEFVTGLSAFSSKGNKEQKLQFAFKVYDIDRDGYISNGELFIVLKMMVGSNLKDQQLQQIVDKTIMEADLDKDGKISFEEFTKMVENTDVSMSMTLGEFCLTSRRRRSCSPCGSVRLDEGMFADRLHLQTSSNHRQKCFTGWGVEDRNGGMRGHALLTRRTDWCAEHLANFSSIMIMNSRIRHTTFCLRNIVPGLVMVLSSG